MQRHGLLRRLHQLLEPRTYLEIGVRDGRSLALSRAQTIAVDPFFAIDHEILCDLHLVRSTSDELFARRHPLAHFDEPVIDLAFIDGMHLAEFALRDLINIERYSHAGTVIVLDDVLPRSIEEGGRTRQGTSRHGAWAGDVYKVVSAVLERRPDLVCLEVNTRPTGTAVILGADATNRVLADAYDKMVADMVSPDPQHVPDDTLERRRALDPAAVVSAPIWDGLRAVRGLTPAAAKSQVSALLTGSGLLGVGRVSPEDASARVQR